MKQYFQTADTLNLEVILMRHSEEYMRNSRWGIVLRHSSEDGTKIEVKKDGNDFEELLQEAFGAFNHLARSGKPELFLAPPVDHEIPF